MPTVATPGLPLDHVPPAGVEPSDSVPLMHIGVFPVIEEGRLFTVAVRVALQPVDRLYEIVVTPPVIPVPIPVVVSTNKTAGEAEVQIPPEGVDEYEFDDPTQMLPDPVMVEGVGFTDNVLVTKQPVEVLTTVILAVPVDIPLAAPEDALI